MKVILITGLSFILFLSGGHANPILSSPSGLEVDAVIPGNPNDNCPAGYTRPDVNWENCYKVYHNAKLRKDASAQCKKDNGFLSSVQNAFVNTYLYSLAVDVGVPSIWLGIECATNETTSCINDDGTPVKYTNFWPGQPNGEDICVSAVGRDLQKWLSFSCQQTYSFACEVNATQSIKSCPANYTEYNGTRYRIYYQDDYLIHDQYATVCAQIPGGTLASIPNKQVDNFLMNFHSDCPFGYSFTIGLKCLNVTSNGDTSSCTWDDGTPFSYNNFAKGDPQENGYTICPYVYQGIWHGFNECYNLATACGACQAPMK